MQGLKALPRINAWASTEKIQFGATRTPLAAPASVGVPAGIDAPDTRQKSIEFLRAMVSVWFPSIGLA
ncbi:MAG: hypothetical protein DMG61_13000 [Acidobacteria bacterium]|nr:MAG: hypothetical protein DMG61_13000 [Acidobacteriota bacterium]